MESHRGSCHCGAVTFEAKFDVQKPIGRCNCSVCTKTSIAGVIVKPEEFVLRTGEDKLSVYEWGGRTSRRFFCATCGVSCFGRGHLAQLGGDYVSVNANCLDDLDPHTLTTIHWDGRHNNWQAGPRETPWPIFS